jgi:hypothetical protein
MADEQELIKMDLAEKAVAESIAIVERELNSNLTPPAQKVGLLVARSQLFGSYAMVRIHNHLLGSGADEKESALLK